MTSRFSDKVHSVVRRIPRGKTLTYAEVARRARPRRRGPWALSCAQIVTNQSRAIALFALTGHLAGTIIFEAEVRVYCYREKLYERRI